ncbi:MAG: response regulator [Cyanobacteria bacterium CRU_2_1]|nr:response regulator [Cyanobacteria bacterium RU_5_0]NJR63746.1 response regulator [Cyanobacteria bacterium CRU_2_1]
MRILLIEDDEILIDVLVKALTSQHHVVDIAEDGQMGWEYAQDATYDLILMDVGLPKLDGITLCQRLRSNGHSTPILLITAKEASGDRIRGLDAGADDYLIKPLDLAELQARVRALLRRGETSRTPVLEFGTLQLDPASCQVMFANKPLTLTPKEYSLLELFLRNPTRVFSRGNIIEHLWTYDDPPQEESVKAHIKGLRQKLKNAGAVDWIENVYGLGYRLNQHCAVTMATTATHEGTDVTGKAGIDKAADGMGKATLTSVTPSASSSATPVTPSVATTVEQQFNQVMGEMWQRYQGLMTQRMSVLHEAATATQTGVLSFELRQSAAQAAHKLAGVLGMFELAQGTDLSRDIERILLEKVDLSPEQQKNLLSLIQELDRLLTLAQANQSTSTAASEQNSEQNTDAPVFKSVEGEQQPEVLSSQLLQRAGALKVNVLVVDDDPIVLAALHPMLEPWGIRMTGLDDPLRFWDVLNAEMPDLLILDVEMPQMNGIELCQAVRADSTWQGLPILFLTVHQDLQTIQQVFAAGADDYVTKPVVGVELLTRMISRLERIRLLQTLSTKDPFTGLLNQPQSSRYLESLLQQAEADGKPMTIAVLRMLELPQINIQYGHTIGNQVLQQWGRLFQATFRDNAVLGYWGNGEFVVGMEVTKAEIDDRLSPLLTSLRQQIFTATEGDRFQVMGRCAIVEYPTDGSTLQALYQAASQLNLPYLA